MRRLALALALLLTLSLPSAIAQDKEAEPPKPAWKMEMVVAPKARLSNRWAFVIDTSHSITNFGVLGGILTGFTTAASSPSDDLWFCAFAFNNSGCHAYRKWDEMPAKFDKDGNITPEWQAIIDWFYGHTGTMSYGGGAINDALHKKVKRLTVIIVSDGGFTEKGPAIKKIIEDAQAWRVENGYGRALILTIGIENHTGPGYPKPSNEICQGWMKDIGVTGGGGYFYVSKERQEAKIAKEK